MAQFHLDLPTKIYFGNYITAKIIREDDQWINGTVLIVTTGRSLIRQGYVAELKDMFLSNRSVKKVIVFDEMDSNPKLLQVKKAVALGRQQGVDCVVGFGGGSAIDAAKATAAGIGSDRDLETYLLDGNEPGVETLPIIAIPTTAGTGSELSKGAILSSPEHHIKGGIRGQHLLPKIAIVDPVYTWSVPYQITMETGFDVLAHAMESFFATKATLFSDMLSEKAIKIVAKYLLRLRENLEDKEAREAMSYASMIMGMNLADVGTCFPHRMQYAIGALTDTGHGKGLACLYPSWIEHEYDVNTEKVEKALYWLTGEQIADGREAKKCISRFLNEIEMKVSLEALGIKEENLDVLPTMVTGNLANDRLNEQQDMVSCIFNESWMAV